MEDLCILKHCPHTTGEAFLPMKDRALVALYNWCNFFFCAAAPGATIMSKHMLQLLWQILRNMEW
jgi:hypothetical protein